MKTLPKCYWPQSRKLLLETAANLIAEKFVREDAFTNTNATTDYLTFKLADYEREVFSVMLLDSQHRLIRFQELFFGTIDAASVYPREVIKTVLEYNAVAVIFAHNHPSGHSEPSQSDKLITERLSDALNLIDVRVLDHIIVGDKPYSFAQHGLL